jgi:hypothetical protein
LVSGSKPAGELVQPSLYRGIGFVELVLGNVGDDVIDGVLGVEKFLDRSLGEWRLSGLAFLLGRLSIGDGSVLRESGARVADDHAGLQEERGGEQRADEGLGHGISFPGKYSAG